jgi:hypothetical protein
MGFGTKTDFESGRALNLNMSYLNMIKPVVEAAGLECVRADEITHSGMIDVPMYEQLLNADVVVADLSTSNSNAFYELGIRHALRPSTTIIVSEDGNKFPFDLNHMLVRKYHHLGEDIGASEATRFKGLLTSAIQEILAKNPVDHDSLVYTILHDLMPPGLQKIQAAVEEEIANRSPEEAALAVAATTADQANANNRNLLMAEADKAQQEEKWSEVKSVLELVRALQKIARQNIAAAQGQTDREYREDTYLLQRLALATYKAELPDEATSLQVARDLLIAFEPDTSNDTETLGMWGSIHKRRWALNKKSATEPIVPGSDCAKDLDVAIRAYKRGFYLRNDYYNGINYAFMLNVRSAETLTTAPAESIADYVQAQRVREEVISICQEWLNNNPPSPAAEAEPLPIGALGTSIRYWVLATLAEAYLGTGRDEQAVLQEAFSNSPGPKVKDETLKQLSKLRELLASNPLELISLAPVS